MNTASLRVALVAISSFGLAAQASQARAPRLADVLSTGVKLLLDRQEHYVPDRRAPRMRDDQVPAWQVRERVRLRRLRDDGKPNVEWPYEGVYRVNRRVPPGYRVGGTAIVCEALVRAPGFQADRRRRAAVARGIEFMLRELRDNRLLGPGPKRGYDVRGWAHIYGLNFLLLAESRGLVVGDEAAASKRMIPHLLDCLAKNECPGGGWNYANTRCSPFMTGSALLALYRANAQGYAVDPKMVKRALRALERARFASGTFLYSGAVRQGQVPRRTSAMPGACARAAIAELCLFRAGRSDAGRLRVAVDAFFTHWNELFKRKSQQGTHIGAYGIAPYYFIYGHTYAALAIEALPAAERPSLRAKMQATLWRTREADGGWNDRIFPRSKSYTTAMALLALLAPEQKPPGWRAEPPARRRRVI